jgi:iron complex transport system permease protein
VSAVDAPRRAALLVGLIALCGATGALALLVGPSGVELPAMDALSLRAPRVVLAALAGAALSCAGAALQGLLRNPLADPYIIGVSGGAALGGAFVVAAGLGGVALLLEGAAFAGAALSSLGLAALVARDRSPRTDATLLAGVVFNFFAAAVITLIKTLIPAERAYALLYWLVGSVGYVDTSTLIILGTAVAVGVGALWARSGELELLALGDDEASRLGVDVGRARLVLYLAASLLVGAVVPITGMIGFVGLVVPHALRLVVGGDLRVVLPASTFLGAAVLIVFDAAARASFAFVGSEIPTGALTAIIGAPVFGALLLRRMREGAA